jgi:hypothetical protein
MSSSRDKKDSEEIERLHAFILQVSERLFLAAEVLSILAEKKRNENGSGPEQRGGLPDVYQG